MEIKYIGWCNEGKHDKVWGVALHSASNHVDSDFYACFWGRRGKKLQKKLVELTGWELYKLIESKQKKGYVNFPVDEANEIYENFSKDIFVVALSVK